MSNAVSLRIDDVDEYYTGGDTVEGTVVVEASEDVKDLGLRFGLGVELEGPENIFGKSLSGLELRAEPRIEERISLRAGSSETFDFAFEVPNGPAPLNPSKYRAIWVIDARIVSSSLELVEEAVAQTVAPFELTIDPNLPYDAGRRPARPTDDVSSSAMFGTSYLVVLAFFGLLGVGMLAVTAYGGYLWYPFIARQIANGRAMYGIYAALAGAALMVLTGTWLVRGAFQRLWLANLVESTAIELDDATVVQGETLQVRAVLETTSRVQLEKAELKLVRREWFGTAENHERHAPNHADIVVQKSEPSADPAGPVERGSEHVVEFHVDVPEGAPSTYELAASGYEWSVIWRLLADFEFTDAPDVHASRQIFVRPGPTGESYEW